MKKSMFLTFGIAIAIFSSILMTSCDKKVVDTMGSASVTMTYSPNPATVNTPITFNFSVMESMMAMDVTDFSCGLMQGSTNNTMTITRTGTGMYMGTYTFTKSDSCKITFNYMHDNGMMMQDWKIFVK